jgi:HlyD family secretion protein
VLRLRRARLDVRAPADGRVDALPFKLGDQPPVGAVLVSLLSGAAPYVRLYIPASQRATLAVGDNCTVAITGRSEKFNAHLRSIEAEPSFTPYYALTGDDASRLVYRAEAVLTDAAAQTLAAGLPVEATCERRAG